MSREQAVTNDLRLVWRYVEANSSVGAQRDETTGVKQLSALAASGEKMLLNQEASSTGPSLQGSSKPRGQRSVSAEIEAICLVVGSTGEPWVGDWAS